MTGPVGVAPMSAATAAAVAARYDLGVPLREPRYADRGELGRIWRLDTERGRWAVKELLHPVAEADAAADVAFQYAAAASGVPLPRPVLTRDGHVVLPGTEAASPFPTLRVYEWVDLLPGVTVTAGDLGAMTARLHHVRHPPAGAVSAWFAEPLGEPAWRGLIEAGRRAGARWADPLGRRLAQLLAVDELIRPTDPARVWTCHRDVNAENLRRRRRGDVVVLDWENSGPLAPERELAAILVDIAAEASVGQAATAYAAYLAADGPARLTGPADFSAAAAMQGHLLEFYGRRTLDASQPGEDRQRAGKRLDQMLRSPLTPALVADLLRTCSGISP